MNEIQIFQNSEFGAIRTVCNEQGDVMFCAKDVALALGYKKPLDAIAHHVESEDSVKHGLLDNRGCKQTSANDRMQGHALPTKSSTWKTCG